MVGSGYKLWSNQCIMAWIMGMLSQFLLLFLEQQHGQEGGNCPLTVWYCCIYCTVEQYIWVGREHGRRINREENGKVIAAVWGGRIYSIPCKFWRIGWIYPFSNHPGTIHHILKFCPQTEKAMTFAFSSVFILLL